MARKHNEDEVLRSFRSKRDIHIKDSSIMVLRDKIIAKGGESIDNPAKTHDLGNGSWGKIDFLVKHCGYSIWQVDKFQNRQ